MAFSRKHIAILFLLTCPAMFATNMLVGRAAADFFPPVALAFWRWFIVLALVSLTAAPHLWRMRRCLISEWKDLFLFGVLGMGVCGAFVYIGAQTTTATNIGLIFSATPIFIVLFSTLVFGEKTSPRQLLGIALSLTGVLVIVAKADIQTFIDLAFTTGDLWIVSGMLGWAIYCVWLKYRPSEMPMQTRFMAICFYGVMILLPFYIAESVWYAMPPLSLESVAAAILVGVIAGYGAYQTYSFVQHELGAGTAGVIMYLIPIYNAGLAWLFLDESVRSWHLIGAALVLPGVWLVTVSSTKQSDEKPDTNTASQSAEANEETR